MYYEVVHLIPKKLLNLNFNRRGLLDRMKIRCTKYIVCMPLQESRGYLILKKEFSEAKAMLNKMKFLSRSSVAGHFDKASKSDLVESESYPIKHRAL